MMIWIALCTPLIGEILQAEKDLQFAPANPSNEVRRLKVTENWIVQLISHPTKEQFVAIDSQGGVFAANVETGSVTVLHNNSKLERPFPAPWLRQEFYPG